MLARLPKKISLPYIRKILKHFWIDASADMPGPCLHSHFGSAAPGQAGSFKAERSRKLEAKELTSSLGTPNGHLIHVLTSLGGSPW